MTRKNRRLVFVTTILVAVSSSAALALWAMSGSLVFYVTPSQLAGRPVNGQQVRLGGLVQAGTVQRADATVRFKVTDGTDSQAVVYTGPLPDLFREGQGVVVTGVEQSDGVFKASEVLAKHDEKYMPKNVAEALKASGRWRPDGGVSEDAQAKTEGKGS
ncbi:MAG TPA: cytochrome c maturation protein CcmE [Rhodopila sp.]|uniref:cytochrome c maturation protein CcmE n=1 Tax=Rhodopila sp. TaxID=2480087 RepID=UPI002CBA3C53|nr:cytochrome c maturation protein CcmE [Rhodopila sp.]HVY14678.1 cytochrome c maturation protein CcmE [Rhodopila sp.]